MAQSLFSEVLKGLGKVTHCIFGFKGCSVPFLILFKRVTDRRGELLFGPQQQAEILNKLELFTEFGNY